LQKAQVLTALMRRSPVSSDLESQSSSGLEKVGLRFL
jgi:hypothetical protein